MVVLKRFSLPSMRQATAAESKITDVEIYFGTMFGSAEQYARTLAHDVATQRRVRVTVHDLDSFDEHTLAQRDQLTASRLFVFVVSTHFAGAPSPSAERFRDWINDLETKPPADAAASASSPTGTWLRSLYNGKRLRLPLRGMHYAVFGIGDSVYLTFNAMGKFVDLKLRQLGATRVCAIGLGDCSNDLEATFKKWVPTLLCKLPARVVSPSPPPKSNFVATLPKTLAIVSTAADNTTGATATATTRTVKSKRVVPHQQQQHYSPSSSATNPDDAGGDMSDAAASVHSLPPQLASRLMVRDNFGRTVRLRFHVAVLTSGQQRLHHAASKPPSSASHSLPPTPARATATGPRTPRVALFDTTPFAEIEAVEVLGDVAPWDCTSPSPPPPAPSPSPSPSPLPSLRRKPAPSLARRQKQQQQHHRRSSSATWSRAATFRVRLLNPETSFVTVSTLAIFPQNAARDVEQIAHAFGYDLDAVIQLRVNDPTSSDDDSGGGGGGQLELPFPTPCTIRTALTEFIDLHRVTRELLRVVSGFVVTTDEYESLEKLASTEHAAAFKTQIQDPHKGLLDLLEMAPTLQIPLEVFVSIMPIIRPRYYTIASSPRVASRELDLAVSLGRVGQPQGCTVAFFEQILKANTSVPLRGFISHSRFQFPDDGVSPMVLIAAGVGVAAMRAIIQDRLMRWFQSQINPCAGGGGGGGGRGSGGGGGGGGGGGALSHPPSLPKHILFLGAANEDTVVFRDDLRYWEQQLYVKVHYAFSNDTRVPRQHIQDVVVTRLDEIFQTVQLSTNSRIIVCGRVPMVRRVREIFETDQVRRGNTWFDVVHSSGRFIDEGFN